MKFDHLIGHEACEPFEYNRNNFLQKSCTKCDGVTSPGPIFKKSKLEISLNQHVEIFIHLVLLYVQVLNYQIVLKLRC